MPQEDAPPDDDVIESALQILEEYLRERRLKMTDQRRTMVRAALEHTGHFTAEELHRALSADGDPVSLATVYRGLAVLEEASLLEGHDFADGTRRYERAIEREHHDHMVCLDCRAVIEFTNERIEKLQQEVVDEHGFTMDDHSLTLFVHCNVWKKTGACDRRAEREERRKSAGIQ